MCCFELQQVVERYDFCWQQIRACDQRLERLLAARFPRRARTSPLASISKLN
jgi:hypothetical protein